MLLHFSWKGGGRSRENIVMMMLMVTKDESRSIVPGPFPYTFFLPPAFFHAST